MKVAVRASPPVANALASQEKPPGGAAEISAQTGPRAGLAPEWREHFDEVNARRKSAEQRAGELCAPFIEETVATLLDNLCRPTRVLSFCVKKDMTTPYLSRQRRKDSRALTQLYTQFCKDPDLKMFLGAQCTDFMGFLRSLLEKRFESSPYALAIRAECEDFAMSAHRYDMHFVVTINRKVEFIFEEG